MKRAWLELAAVALLAALLYLPALDAYSLYDPWETHYGEVARRMLEDEDYVVTRWQNEVFRSKPVLTFWLMAASMKLHGVGEDGGWSGEFVASHRLEGALRLPFALFGAGGLVALWILLRRLVSRRAAWLATAVTATMPWYFLISRQAITDMPACALLVGAVACFALATLEEDRPGRRATWILLGASGALVLSQLLYFSLYLGGTRLLLAGLPIPALAGMAVLLAVYAAFVATVLVWRPGFRQVLLFWMYLFLALSVLAKGLAALGVAVPALLLYLLATRQWRLLRELEIPRGLLLLLAVALPWHVAMYAKDGMAWWAEYVNQHLIGRALRGVHGDRGSFRYFFSQMGPGMWPWIALVPGALVSALLRGRPERPRDKLHALFAAWAVAGFFFFSIVQTKFHHYLLPAVPAFAALVGLYLDELLERREGPGAAAVVLALGLLLVTTLDVVGSQHTLVNLFVYRYDRPWPYGPPWNLTFATPLGILGALFACALVLLFVPRLVRWGVGACAAAALAAALFVMHVLVPAAAPHWGQRQLHELYFAKRRIQAVEVRGSARLPEPLHVRAKVPETLHAGDPMPVRVRIGPTVKELHGQVTRLGDDAFDVSVPAGERAQLAGLPASAPGRLHVVADRLLAWQLNWRGENLYSNGEIWDAQDEDGRTVFVDTDNKRFLDYLRAPARTGKGRRFWLITEKARAPGLKNVLPTEKAKETFREEENSSNKFGLVSFTLD